MVSLFAGIGMWKAVPEAYGKGVIIEVLGTRN